MESLRIRLLASKKCNSSSVDLSSAIRDLDSVINLRAGFASAVRSARSRRGWSQEDLAERAGLHRTYVSDVERGLRNVSIDNIARIAEALDTLPSVLFVEAEESRE